MRTTPLCVQQSDYNPLDSSPIPTSQIGRSSRELILCRQLRLLEYNLWHRVYTPGDYFCLRVS